MQFAQPFDARGVDPSAFPPPPVLADYHVRITNSEVKPVKDKPESSFLELTLEILDPGPYAGRTVPYRLNILNQDAGTREGAYRQLSALCHVTKQFPIQDSRQLWNIPFIATIGPQSNNPQYPNVFFVKDLDGVVPGSKPASAPAGYGAPAAAPVAAAPPAAAPPAWGPPPTAAPPAAAPPAWGPPAATAPPTAAPPAWGPPPAAAAPPAAPAWAQAPPAAAAPAKAPWER